MTTNSPDLAWEDPPQPQLGTRVGRWEPVADQLREHPGKWAVIATYPLAQRPIASSLTNALSHGKYRGIDGVQAVSRTVNDEVKVYARWVAPDE